jgi:hypothetical protein
MVLLRSLRRSFQLSFNIQIPSLFVLKHDSIVSPFEFLYLSGLNLMNTILVRISLYNSVILLFSQEVV